MAFTLAAPYTILLGTSGSTAICQQDGACYIVRIDWPPMLAEGPIPHTAIGPYADATEAMGHLGELPPPPVYETAPPAPPEPTA